MSQPIIRRSGILAVVSGMILFPIVFTDPFAGTAFGPYTVGGDILVIFFLGLFLGATAVYIYSGKKDFNLWEALLAIVLAIAWVPTLLGVMLFLFLLCTGGFGPP
ncbi:MAG TPA: hypothetical protein VHM26_16945 [Chitinophagaceae bacterium]|nr:hypothetical protein [Chitinophagaceae bacterium]